jgi:hypothetical protein
MATNKTILSRVKNMFFPGIGTSGPPAENNLLSQNIVNDAKELNKYRGPVQLVRIKGDTSFWRSSIAEAERPLPALPYRVQMQQIFIDTVLNGHVSACMQKRKNLTLLKKYAMVDEQGNENEEATKLIDTAWFNLIRNYIHDAKFYGYSLITFGDLIDGGFPNLQITRRADVSPDRLVLSSFQYIPTGINFMDENEKDPNGNSYYDWSLYVTTPSENGVSVCGYGLLYKVALYEIIMRSIIGWNTDYIERYGQPTVVIKTIKDSEDERGAAEQAAQNLGSSGYMIMDKQDEFEYVETSNSGTGWQSYDNLEQRCKKIISSIILGHEDGISSTPGKLGSGQGGNKDVDDSPIGRALAECESIDSRFEENVINNHLLPKLIKLGFTQLAGLKYQLKNDQEEYIEEKRMSETALSWATIAKTMHDAGLNIDVDTFVENSGIKADRVVAPEPMNFSSNLKAKLERVYK